MNKPYKIRLGLYKTKIKVKKYLLSKRRLWVDPVINPLLVRNKQKIFCIGQNKTGTTSLKRALEDLKIIVGDQKKGERLLNSYFEKKYIEIEKYCHSGQAFQDVPFSLPQTYIFLDNAFPNSKFILTIRNSPEQWYNSLLEYHKRMFGKGSTPTEAQLKAHPYIWPGWAWTYVHNIYNAPKDMPYHKETLISRYVKYNDDVINYFKNQPDKLLILNLEDPRSYPKFCTFIGAEPIYNTFPWENKTIEFRIR